MWSWNHIIMEHVLFVKNRQFKLSRVIVIILALACETESTLKLVNVGFSHL